MLPRSSAEFGSLERLEKRVIITTIVAKALFHLQPWNRWSKEAVGLWVPSLWVLGLSGSITATWCPVIVGILVHCVAGCDVYGISVKATRRASDA